MRRHKYHTLQIGTDDANNMNSGYNNDHMFARKGNDFLYSAGGDDFMVGGQGDDVLFDHGGMQSASTLIGWEGADTFMFDGNNGIDTIMDFEPGVDVIDLSLFGPIADSLSDLDLVQGYDDVYLTLGTSLIVLMNTDLSTMQFSDFVF